MSRTYIVVENAVEFAVYSEENGLRVAAFPHDEDFPPLNEEGYEHEFVDHDGADEDSVAFSYEGCPLGYLREIVIPAYVDAAERQRPMMTRVVTTILDMHAAYDRIILPQKNSAGRSEWCIGLLDVQLLLPAASKEERFDDVDLGILQLVAEGASTREIAAAVSRSHRTIEHRIERLKLRFRARSVAHLVALSISASVGRLTRRGD